MSLLLRSMGSAYMWGGVNPPKLGTIFGAISFINKNPWSSNIFYGFEHKKTMENHRYVCGPFILFTMYMYRYEVMVHF